MDNGLRKTFLRPVVGSNALRRGAEAILRPDYSIPIMNGEAIDTLYDDDNSLAPVMPAIDVVQQLMEKEQKDKLLKDKLAKRKTQSYEPRHNNQEPSTSNSHPSRSSEIKDDEEHAKLIKPTVGRTLVNVEEKRFSPIDNLDEEDSNRVRVNPLSKFVVKDSQKKQEEYEFVPKSAILDVYSNDPEVKKFLKQLPKICNQFGYNEQDYKCYSCRRPIGMVFGQSRLCHFDGHQYCSECHLGEKSAIPARILCNWDFNKYSISKRNQHFLTLISNEPMFELKAVSPLLYKVCPELREIENLRRKAFFIRSYCFTCAQDSISLELTKLVWPREHLIKQIDLYSLEDLMQIKGGSLKQVLNNVISFGRQHVLSCMLCCQKGFYCGICDSSEIIYPFDTEYVHRCNGCRGIYHKTCFRGRSTPEACPRCQRLKTRQTNS